MDAGRGRSGLGTEDTTPIKNEEVSSRLTRMMAVMRKVGDSPVRWHKSKMTRIAKDNGK